MNEPLKFGFDAINDEPYGVDHNIYAANKRGVELWEAYCRKDVACHFHLRIYIGRKGHSHDLCADFQALGGVGDSQWRSGTMGRNRVGKADHHRGQQRWVEHLVFVPVGEVAEGFDSSARVVRSVVGLRAVNECPLRRRDFVEMYPLVREPVLSILNRELDLFGFSRGLGNSDVVAVELPEQVVEGAPKIVDDVPQDDADFESPFLWHCCDPKDMITRLGVELGAHLEKFGFPVQEGCDYGIQLFAMLIRPLNLGSTLGKVNRHGKRQYAKGRDERQEAHGWADYSEVPLDR
jgi:hypothetical protein